MAKRKTTTKKRSSERVVGTISRPKNETLSGDLATLERDANFEERQRSANDSRTVVCFNRTCPDYKRVRPWDEPCGCKRRRVGKMGNDFGRL